MRKTIVLTPVQDPQYVISNQHPEHSKITEQQIMQSIFDGPLLYFWASWPNWQNRCYRSTKLIDHK